MTSFHMKICKIQISGYFFFFWLLLCYNGRVEKLWQIPYGPLLWTELCPPQVHMFTPQFSSIWRRGIWEILGLGWGPRDRISAFIKRGTREPAFPSPIPRPLLGPTSRWGQGEAASYKPDRGCSPGPDQYGILTLDFQFPELWEKKFQLLKPPNLWYYAMAAWADQYT